MKNIFDVSLDYLLCLDDYSSHIEYAKSKLKLNDELLELLFEISSNKELIQKVNWYVQHDLRKEILNYENQSYQQSI